MESRANPRIVTYEHELFKRKTHITFIAATINKKSFSASLFDEAKQP